MKLCLATCRGKEKNTLYEKEAEIATLNDLKNALRYDHIAPKMRGNHRSNEDYLSADCIMFDCDNSHSEEPEHWQSIGDIAEAFPDVRFYYARSRNYMKPKRRESKETGEEVIYAPREKFHFYFPLSKILTDGKEYEALMLKAAGLFPYFDLAAAKPAQMFYGVENPEVFEEAGYIYLDEYLAEVTLEDVQKSVNEFAAKVRRGEYQQKDRKDTKELEKAISRLFAYFKFPDNNVPMQKDVSDSSVFATSGEVIENGLYDGLGLRVARAEQKRSLEWFKEFADTHKIPLGKMYRPKNREHPEVICICVTCPWGNDHTMNGSEDESVVMVELGGKLCYLCRHDHCTGRNWKDYRAFYEERDGSDVTSTEAEDKKDQKTTLQQPQNKIAHVKSLAEVEAKEAPFLIPDYIPEGAITILFADGGTGKTAVECDIAAAVSSGSQSILQAMIPPEQFNKDRYLEPKRVLFMSGEESPQYTLKNRIACYDANMENIYVIDPEDGELYNQCTPLKGEFFQQILDEIRPALCIIDPLQSFIEGTVHMESRNAMRHELDCLMLYAKEYGTTFLIAMHTNKREGVAGRGKMADSSDMWDIARSALQMGWTQKKGIRYLSHEKSNWGVLQETIELSIEDGGKVVYRGSTEKKAADYENEKKNRRSETQQAQTNEEAQAAILDFLTEASEMSANDLMRQMLDCGHSKNAYKMACAELKKQQRIEGYCKGKGHGKGTCYYYKVKEKPAAGGETADGEQLDISGLELDELKH